MDKSEDSKSSDKDGQQMVGSSKSKGSKLSMGYFDEDDNKDDIRAPSVFIQHVNMDDQLENTIRHAKASVFIKNI